MACPPRKAPAARRRTGTGERGAFQFALHVYGREGEPCVRCGTRLTGTHDIDGRISVLCHRCQA
jgi:formamidopyrimidine-DNA glycosylase